MNRSVDLVLTAWHRFHFGNDPARAMQRSERIYSFEVHMNHQPFHTCCAAVVFFGATLHVVLSAIAAEPPEVTFSTAFEGGSLGRIEKLGETTFRVHVLGQQDELGRNRAATW